MLEAIVEAKIKIAPEAQLEIAYKFILQIFQRIFAYIALIINLLLVDIAISHTKLLKELLGRNELIKVEIERSLCSKVLYLSEVYTLP